MLNKEFYKEQLTDFLIKGDRFALPKQTNKLTSCEKTLCTKCHFFANESCANNRRKWLNEEYVELESEVDWSKVPVDTPILVRNYENNNWMPRYFDKYENGIIYAWCDGATSWSAQGRTLAWNYAKLLEEFEAESNEAYIDWTKIPVDTPVLVKDYQDQHWHERYFCKCENGKVYTWDLGNTSRSIDNTNHITGWKYAKLVVNWSKISIDTPILVRDLEYEDWKLRYFAEYDDGMVFAWADGMTSSEVRGPQDALPWSYAKLTETA